jgi:hypothetical protein
MNNINDGLRLLEIVKAEIYRGKPDGYSAEPDESVEPVDLITTAGRVWLAKRIASDSAVVSAMAYMAIGSGSTAPALGDTTLVKEVKRKILSTNTTAAGDNVYTAVATFGGFADTIQSIAIVEAGILNHASSGNGTLFQRVTFASVTLADSDLLKITLQTNVGSS